MVKAKYWREGRFGLLRDCIFIACSAGVKSAMTADDVTIAMWPIPLDQIVRSALALRCE